MLKKLKLSLRAFFRIGNWWDFFLDYLNLKKGYVIYKIADKKIKTRAGSIDKSIITELVLEDKYFPKWFSLKKEAVVVDLGAHIGIFSVLINEKVFAIEPSSDNFSLLLENVKMNKSNVVPLKIAISNESGWTKLYAGRHSARYSLIERERSLKSKFDIIKTMTLKDLFINQNINKCNLLKIDIEGAEYAVLYSTPREIFRKIDNIFLEIHNIPGEDRNNLLKFLKKQGFVLRFGGKDFLYATKMIRNT